MTEPSELTLRRPSRGFAFLRTSRLARFVRALRRSPLVRIVALTTVVVIVRSGYLHVQAEREQWGVGVRVGQLRHSVRAGDALRADDLVWRRLPRIAIGTGAIGERSTIAGQRFARDVDAGEIVSRSQLSGGEASRLSARTGAGRRAISIPLREVLPVVRVGDAVDLVDASGATVAVTAVVVHVTERQVTVAVTQRELASVARAIGGPITVALVGAG